jgi:hypothetical protein
MRPAAALVAVSCLFLAACGRSSGGASSAGSVPGAGQTLEQIWRGGGDDVAVVPGTDHYAPGDVRVSFLIVDSKGRVIAPPKAHVWLARSLSTRPFLESTAVRERIGASGGATADSTSIYVAHFRVRKPGKYWLLAVPEGRSASVRAVGNVDVLSSDPVPGIGDRAPASATPTLASAGGDAARVTTRVPPDLPLLRWSVAQSLRTKVPFVVTFATPKFCTSRTCGPVVDVALSVARHFRGSGVRFIHVEVYEGNDPSRGYNRWMQQWHLTTEPWTFVVDRRGRVSSRFQGAVSVGELERAVERVAR